MALESFLGKVSGLAQTGVAKAKELTDAGVAKSKELAEIGRLKVDNATEQENIKKVYLEIGRLYFDEHGGDPEEPFAGLCGKIAAAKEKIEYNLQRIADIKAASDASDEDTDGIEITLTVEEDRKQPQAPETPEAPDAPDGSGGNPET